MALRVRLDYGASASGVGRPRVAAADRLVRDVVERALASTLAEAVGRAPPARRHELARQLGEAADALRSLALSAGATEVPGSFPRGKSSCHSRWVERTERGYGKAFDGTVWYVPRLAYDLPIQRAVGVKS